MECKQCKKACENNHMYVQELPDTQALPLCRIKEQVPKGTHNINITSQHLNDGKQNCILFVST